MFDPFKSAENLSMPKIATSLSYSRELGAKVRGFGVKEGISWVVSVAQYCGKARNLALP